MRARILITLIFFLLIDFYAFTGVDTLVSVFNQDHLLNYTQWGFWTFSLGILLMVVYSSLTFSSRKGPNVNAMRMLGLLILVYVPKLVYSAFLLLEDIYRLGRAGVVTLMSSDAATWACRNEWWGWAGMVLATFLFFAISHGLIWGKHRYKVWEETLFFEDLPEAFDGFTITQLSDVHSGSFTNAKGVKKGIDKANALGSDMLVFTGDLVNNLAEEMAPWESVFSELEAKEGKYSILGNHDYADYVSFSSVEAKQANLEALKEVHRRIGFQLLENEHLLIERDGEQIALIGIENWGLPPFPQKGDLAGATKQLTSAQFKILLSHDPSHWDAQVVDFEQQIHLTLSGHTHGMQFGIEWLGLRWSPVKYRYPRWAGLFERAGQYLYVNRGFGFIGFPGRVGIWPEITKITLKKKQT